jgi:hypothetical protein
MQNGVEKSVRMPGRGDIDTNLHHHQGKQRSEYAEDLFDHRESCMFH